MQIPSVMSQPSTQAFFALAVAVYKCHPSTNAASESLDHTQKHRTHRPEPTLGGGTRGPRCEAVAAVLKLIVARILDSQLQQLSHRAGVVETDCLIGLGQSWVALDRTARGCAHASAMR